VNTLPSSLERFASQLEEAIRRDRDRRPRRLVVRTGLAAAAAAAIALGVLSVVPGNGPSVVQRAEAALRDTNGTILHVVIAETNTASDGSVSRVRFERWEGSTSPFDYRELRTGDGVALEIGLTGRAVQLYDPTSNTIYEQAAPKQPEKPGDAGKGGTDGGDPYRTKVLNLLQDGRLREDGHTTVDGRDALRLVSPDGTTTLDVDASTYEPTEWRVADHGRVMEDRFTTFERLPVSDAAGALLSVAAQHPGAAVDDDPADYAAAVLRLTGKDIRADAGVKKPDEGSGSK
jgi:hypothetical protein